MASLQFPGPPSLAEKSVILQRKDADSPSTSKAKNIWKIWSYTRDDLVSWNLKIKLLNIKGSILPFAEHYAPEPGKYLNWVVKQLLKSFAGSESEPSAWSSPKFLEVGMKHNAHFNMIYVKQFI